jgi:hypothetical protein
MKSHTFSFKVTKPKHRAHYVLFCEDTPFKPKVVASKTKFKRRPKHRYQDAE